MTGVTTAWLAHPDGSWALTSGLPGEAARVRQAGPRRLWDLVDHHREQWLTYGQPSLPGATARITPDGTFHLSNGPWHVTIPPNRSRRRHS